MTDLDSILKSRDTTLPTKVRLVKVMVLPVVMYGCASSRKFLKRRAPPPYWTVVPGPSWADGTCQPLGTQADKQLKKIEKPSFKMIFLNPREEKMTKALCLLT